MESRKHSIPTERSNVWTLDAIKEKKTQNQRDSEEPLELKMSEMGTQTLNYSNIFGLWERQNGDSWVGSGFLTYKSQESE